MHIRLNGFLEDDILYKNQFGFRKDNSSLLYALLQITEKIRESIDKVILGVVFSLI